jgi:3-dehydroquinate synthase
MRLEVPVVSARERGYPIDIVAEPPGEVLPGVLREVLSPGATRVLVVSDDNVAPLYAPALEAAIGEANYGVTRVVLPAGEAAKSLERVSQLLDAAFAAKLSRRDALVALGGGVVGDVTGFAASIYQRGIDVVQVPTTLLAQVDSSVGGKTAINHPLGKNMIGAFYQPLRVLADLATLDTLPPREIAAGLAEVIKYGPIADDAFLDWIDAHLEALLARDRDALAHAVRRSCEIKAAVVGQDEREAGLRAILNFGHTFGHAIETGLGHGVWLHGEAVACGMVMASALSARLGLMPPDFVERMRRLLERAGLPVRGPDLGAERYLELMRVDKKARAGEIRFVLVEALGQAVLRAAPDEAVRDVLAAHAGA